MFPIVSLNKSHNRLGRLEEYTVTILLPSHSHAVKMIQRITEVLTSLMGLPRSEVVISYHVVIVQNHFS